MYSEKLKENLKTLAHGSPFATKHHPQLTPDSAVIFGSVADNFHPHSHSSILSENTWLGRLDKIHSHFPGSTVYEMQSSNSSDALLMNIFCYPDLPGWKGVAKLFRLDRIEKDQIRFGYKAGVQKLDGPDETEVDLFLNEKVFCEAKLTEENFTEKAKDEVLKYRDFTKVFALGYLPQTNTHYLNYQLIRNILAAHQHQMDFRLLVDARRPDLVKSFMNTVACIIDVQLRTRCKVVFWQDIAAACGKDLQEFLAIKYGL